MKLSLESGLKYMRFNDLPPSKDEEALKKPEGQQQLSHLVNDNEDISYLPQSSAYLRKKKLRKIGWFFLCIFISVILFSIGIAIGYVKFNTVPVCPSKCQKCTAVDICTECVTSYYPEEDGVCTACSAECIECSGKNQCTKCSSSTYLYKGECEACSSNCDSCISNDVCTLCSDRFFLKDGVCSECSSNCDSCIASDVCTLCTKGSFLLDGVCSACPNECKTCEGFMDCQECSYGLILKDGKCISEGGGKDAIIMVGGSDGRSALSSIEVIHLLEQHQGSCEVPPLPEPRFELMIELLQNHLIACGGDNGSGSYSSTCWSLDVSLNNPEWKNMAPLPLPFIRATLTLLRNELYLFGGSDKIWSQKDEIYVYDMNKDIWIETSYILPSVNDAHCTLSLEDYAVVTGGWPNMVDVEMSNLKNDEWQKLPKMNQRRWGHACEVVSILGEIQLVVAGGYYSANTMEYFNWAKKDKWIIFAAELKYGRTQFPALGIMAGKAFVAGGQTQNYFIEEVDIMSNSTWKESKITTMVKREKAAYIFTKANLLSFC